MTETLRCDSCTMPIESGALCQHCADTNGALRPFDELFPRMVQWTMRQDSGIDRATAEQKTLQFMASMPAWRNDAEVKRRLG